jgi:hypothetical protein
LKGGEEEVAAEEDARLVVGEDIEGELRSWYDGLAETMAAEDVEGVEKVFELAMLDELEGGSADWDPGDLIAEVFPLVE